MSAKDLTNDIVQLSLNEGKEVDWDNTNNAKREFELTAADDKILVLVRHDDTSTDDEDCTVIIKAGDFHQAGHGDITFTIKKDEYFGFIFDSAIVKDENDKVNIELENTDEDAFGTGDEGAADIGIAIVEL